MINLLNKRASSEIKNFIKSNHQKIDVKAGKCRYNYKCHMNTVHDAINNKEKSIVMCIYVEDDHPIIHFLNKDKKGKYTDNTLGNWCVKYNFYFIREIIESEFFDVNKIFGDYRKSLRKKLSFFTRLLSDITN